MHFLESTMAQSTSLPLKISQGLPLTAQQPQKSTLETWQQSTQGIIVAGTILIVWLISLCTLLSISIVDLSAWGTGVAVIWQTFLYTGLFITAHDAMHGTVCASSPRINNTIGALATFCYGLFSYRELCQKHRLHHKFPGTKQDPDFYHEGDGNCLSWYFQFMVHYWSWSRILALILVFHGIHYFLPVPGINLALFWVLPSIASSVQLFYFGTFLTHRKPKEGHTNPHCAETIHFSTFWSFITCYHFGYHQEHHEYPQTPWWRLPEIYQRRVAESQKLN